jgi:glycosyltransferase involved in cell wall biosynthesis
MRIVRVSERCYPHPGGKEVHVLELSRRQAERGHDVQLVYRTGEPPHGNVRGLRPGVGRLGRRDDRLRTALFLGRSVAYIVRNRRTVDLAHFHGDYLEAFAAGIVRAVGVPSILTLHGRLSDRVVSKIGRVYRFPSHIIAVSESIRDQLGAVGLEPIRFTVQSSGVNREVFQPAPAIPVKPFTAVFVGSLIPLKDVWSIFEAVTRVAASGIPIVLNVVGRGPEEEALRAGAPSCVRFHGSIPRDEVAAILRASHVSVLASIDTPTAGEGTPTVLMEALACGLPFVATGVGGVPALARRSRAGIVVRQRDPDAFAVALTKLASNADEYAQRRAAALAYAPKLDWNEIVDRIDIVSRRVVRRGDG